MEQKKELIALIESIDNDKAFNYLLGFVKMFCEQYLYFRDGKWTKQGVSMEQELREMMEKIYKNENALHRIHSFVRIFIQRYM